MTQEEKILARLKSANDGLINFIILKKDGEIFCWWVDVKKTEGLEKLTNSDEM